MLMEYRRGRIAEEYRRWGRLARLARFRARSHSRNAYGGGQTGSFPLSETSNHYEPSKSCRTNFRKRPVCPRVPPQQQWKTWWPGIGESCWEVYRRRFVSTRLAATLLADGAPCFAICACPALVIKRDCSYISIHFSLEIAEISLPIASSGRWSGDSK